MKNTEFSNKVMSILKGADISDVEQFLNSEFESNEVNEFESDSDIEIKNEFKESEINFTLADNYGGEGKGEEYWSVYKFFSTTNNDDFIYVKFYGWYSSYNGSEFTDFEIVNAKEKTVIVFE